MSVSQKPNHGRNAAPTKRHGFRSTFNMTGVIIGILGLILATVAIIIPVYEGKISSLKEEHNNGFAQATQRLAAAAARIDSLENALKALQSKNFTLAQQLNWERQKHESIHEDLIELQGIVNQALALSFANNATFNQYRIKLQTALQDIRNEARSTSDLLSRCDLIRADFDTSDTIVTMKELIPRARDSENVSILAHTQKMREHYRVLNELTRKIQLASQTDPDLQVNNFVEGLARIPDVLQHIEAFAKPREVVFFKNGDKHNHLSDSLRIPKHARRDVRAANASSIDSAAAQTLKPQPAFVLNHKSPENNLSAFDIFTSASASSLNFNLEPMPGQQYWIERKGKPTLLRTSVKSIIAPSFSTNGHDHPGGRGSNTQSYSSRIKIPAFYDVLKSPAHVPIENFAFLFRDTVKPTLELKGWDSRFDEEIQNQKKRLVKIETKKKELHLDRELVFEELKKMNTEVERHLNSPLARFYRNGNNYQF